MHPVSILPHPICQSQKARDDAYKTNSSVKNVISDDLKITQQITWENGGKMQGRPDRKISVFL